MIIVNGVLSLYCAGLGLLLLFLGVTGRTKVKSRATTISHILLVTAIVMLLSDGISLCFLRKKESLHVLYAVLNGLSFTAFYALMGIYSWYLAEILPVKKSRRRKAWLAFAVSMCSIGLLLWTGTCVQPLFYNIRSGEVTNAVLYRLAGLPGILAVTADLLVTLKNSRRFDKTDLVLLLTMPLLPLTAALIGPLLRGLSLQYPLILAGVMINHFRFDGSMDYQLALAEEELQKLRLRMTLERVKPHYVYNVLTSVYYLCEKDPQQAQTAIAVFSDYLREALRGMEKEEYVPFSWELSLIENYLKLEKLRFEDRLSVEYSVQEKDFLIPPFTVQPLVENAVKHGMKDRSCLHVRIESFRGNGGYQVLVSDDGAGFEMGAEKSAEPSGLRNIQELLQFYDSGSLRITSKPGEGTTASLLFRGERNTHNYLK